MSGAQDNLEDSIEKFPGYSSWNEYREIEPRLDAETSESFPWLRLPSIPKLQSRTLSEKQDSELEQSLRDGNKKSHPLVRMPNAWMRCFGVEGPEEVAAVNERVLSCLREKEEMAREQRASEGKRVMGARLLQSQPILKEHKPKKKSRKIFVISSIKELRIRLIAEFKAFCEECRACLERWRSGDIYVVWPPGAFKPPLRPTANILP